MLKHMLYGNLIALIRLILLKLIRHFIKQSKAFYADYSKIEPALPGRQLIQ